MKNALANEVSNDLVDEIIEELPLDERVQIAYLNEDDIEILKLGTTKQIICIRDNGDLEDLNNVLVEVWNRLRDTHRLRLVKNG